MKIIEIPLIQCSTVKEFKNVFITELVDCELFFNGIRLKVISNDFEHACYERGVGGVEKAEFGIRRARRILIIKSVCDGKIPYRLLWQNDRTPKTLCVLCEEAECAFYLKPRIIKGIKTFIFLTLIVFGSGAEKRIKKQLENSEEIDDIEHIFVEAD